MKTFSDAHESLTGPSDLIASLPGILGFYPQESVVLLGLCPNDDPSTVTLGPVMRADLAHASRLCGALDELPVEDCIAFYAVVITRIPDSDLATEAVDALYDARVGCGAPLIDACWRVSEIATGTTYSIVFGPGPGYLASQPWGGRWVSGTVSSVMASPAMKALHDNGALPELHREDTYRLFDPIEPEDEAEADNRESLERLAQERAVDMWLRVKEGDCGVKQAADDICALLRKGPEHPLVAAWEDCHSDALLGEEDDRFQLATMLYRSLLRDALMYDALHAPLTAGRALLAVAKTYSGVIRANALSLWAIIAVDRGLTSWSLAALTTVQQELPGHSLSELLIALIHSGRHEGMLEVARRGSLDVWGDLG